ncbi:toprim domain-containing protein [Bacillus toyonensis]|uniref:toprim domain-containing protein n=1 Tax=Bacillus toyonensis TaxID=155322 RepID=UPI002E23C818|nr:toprim domain-containing protein [Bacillus toyonensis]
MLGFIVEGINDVKKLKMVLQKNTYFVVLNGINYKQEQINEIIFAINTCEKVFILTDPDEAGDKIAKAISTSFPTLERIVIDPDEAKVLKKRGYKYGVEYCSNKYLLETFKNYQISLTN